MICDLQVQVEQMIRDCRTQVANVVLCKHDDVDKLILSLDTYLCSNEIKDNEREHIVETRNQAIRLSELIAERIYLYQ